MTANTALNVVEERAFAFAEEVGKQAVAIIDAAVAEVAFEDDADPKRYGIVLLCRSISNFQGAVTMARHDQAVESRTLVRSCVENLLLIDDLRKRRADSVKDMQSNDEFYKTLHGEAALRRPGVADGPLAIIKDLVERLRLKKLKKLTVGQTAKGEIAWMYDTYALLSHDAAHPSITALKRHWQVHNGHFAASVVPPFKPGERLATLDWACDALLFASIGVSLLLGGTSQDAALRALGEQLMRQGRHAAEQQ